MKDAKDAISRSDRKKLTTNVLKCSNNLRKAREQVHARVDVGDRLAAAAARSRPRVPEADDGAELHGAAVLAARRTLARCRRARIRYFGTADATIGNLQLSTKRR